jgi:cytochrome c biogenesis protein CcdA
MNALLENISGLMQSDVWLAPLLALAAGILTSFTPCSLSGIPLVIGFVGGAGRYETKTAFRLSLVLLWEPP